MSRLLLLPAALLLAGTSFATAETPLTDPVPPAVLGRPLEQIRPAPAPAKPKPAKPQAAKAKSASPSAAAGQRPAKQAVDDRGDPRMRSDDVGKGTRFAKKRMGPGAYFGERHRTAVRSYYAKHPARGGQADWQIGEPVPRGAALAPVPGDLLSALPKLPPGHQYVQLGGEVVLIAAGSKMVVDGISRQP